MSKRVVSLLLTLLLALSVCIPVFATTVEPADQTDVSESAETEETAEEEPSEEEPAEEAPAEEAPAEEATEPVEEPEATSEEVDEISQDDIAPIDAAGTYYVKWDASNGTLTFSADGRESNTCWKEDSTTTHTGENTWHASDIKSQVKNVVFESNIKLNGGHLFENFTSLESIVLKSPVEISLTADSMFSGCTALTKADLSNLKVSSREIQLKSMFSGCTSLTKLDISGLDTTGASATDMLDIFTGCEGLKELTVGGNFVIPEGSQTTFNIHTDQNTTWSKSDGTKIGNDGRFLAHFSTVGQGGTYYWGEHYDYYVVLSDDETKLTFQTETPEGEEGVNWWGEKSDEAVTGSWHDDDPGDIKNKIKTVEFVGDITLNGTRLLAYFSKLETVTGSGTLTVVGKIANMFNNCESLRDINIAEWDVSSLGYMSNVFCDCKLLSVLDLSSWDTSIVVGMQHMFKGCTSLREVTVGENFHMPSGSDDQGTIHDANNAGVWVKSDDLQGTKNKWTDEELKTLFEEGNAPGTYYWVHTLTYNGNGGSGNPPTDDKLYMYNGDAKLSGQGELVAPDQQTFIGWSETPKVLVEKEEDESNVIKEGGTVHFDNNNKTVYAVWAVDKNRDGTPDYRESFVDITFDINGGDGSKDTHHSDTFTENDKVVGTPLNMYVYGTLKWTKTWNKDGRPATHPAILAGWSTEKISDIILENDKDGDGKKLSDKLVNRTTEGTVPDKDTTYYAVYAADEDNNGDPDYLAKALRVEYYANGGKRVEGRDWFDGINGLFYRCSHHHVPNEDGVVLLTVDQGKGYVVREGATLIGWSETVVKNLVTSEAEEEAAGIVTEVTMPAEGNKKVYAVWAEDANNNDIPDYREKKVTITFNIGGGHGTGTDAEHSTTFSVDLLPGTYFDLPIYAQLHWSEVWEKDGAAADFEAILAGWADHPINDVILEDDVNDKAEVHAHLSDKIIGQPHIKVLTSATTYYAVYAADENDDGIPDYLEFAEQVEYYANGGTRVSGSWLDGIEGLFYRCGHHHVAGEEVTLLLVRRGKELVERDGATLIGWSVKPVEELVTSAAAEEDAGLTGTYVMPGGGNGKVYAVWAIDENGNGTPDYEETVTPEEPEPKPTPTSKPESTPSTKPTPTPTPKPDYGIIPDVPWYQYQPEDEGEYVPGPDEVTYSGFPDVDPSAWYAGPVGWAAQSGVTAGYPDGNFHPDDTCTRAQIVTFLWKAAGTPMSVGSVSFSDVEQGSFYYDAAVWAANTGIIAGYPDGNFHPDDPCTRAQIVAMLYRFANSPAVSGESKFFDVDAGAYYYNAAIWAEQNGIVAGYPDGGFHPDDVCTRAQIVTMLYNYIKG